MIPQRVVSLVPSITELLYDIGLEDSIVGVTRYCVHPTNALRDKVVVGGTKHIDIDKLKSVRPDFVIANKEENTKEQIEIIQTFCPVFITDVYDLETALEMNHKIGQILNREDAAIALNLSIRNEFLKVSKIKNKTACYLIWYKPYMTIGQDTFIHAMMSEIGLENVFKNRKRYPIIDDITMVNADYILLSSEPYPFKQRHIDELRELCPQSKILFVDGEMFSWYGSRLKLAPTYFNQLISSIE